jgi:hypothetical protein
MVARATVTSFSVFAPMRGIVQPAGAEFRGRGAAADDAAAHPAGAETQVAEKTILEFVPRLGLYEFV